VQMPSSMSGGVATVAFWKVILASGVLDGYPPTKVVP
jgi:hypothetical protein